MTSSNAAEENRSIADCARSWSPSNANHSDGSRFEVITVEARAGAARR